MKRGFILSILSGCARASKGAYRNLYKISLFELLKPKLCCVFLRLQRLEHLFARFTQKCDSLAAWITETKAFFKKDNIAEADLNELLVCHNTSI